MPQNNRKRLRSNTKGEMIMVAGETLRQLNVYKIKYNRLRNLRAWLLLAAFLLGIAMGWSAALSLGKVC